MITTKLRVATGATACPRCDGQVIELSLSEPTCLQCGWVDYTVIPDRPKVSDMIRYLLLRYGGDSTHFKDTLVRVRVVEHRTKVNWGFQYKVILELNCPMCGLRMEQTSLTGSRKNISQERYQCEWGHRISVQRRSEFAEADDLVWM